MKVKTTKLQGYDDINAKAVVLYSGGMDSIAILRLALNCGREVHTLMVDYGQRHVKELEFAKTQLAHMGVAWTMVKMPLNRNICRSKLLGDAGTRYEGVHAMHVPSRNMFLVSLAAMFCESNDFDEIWIGCDYSDCVNEFPDCKQNWVVAMNNVLAINASKPLTLVAPMLGMSKEMITDVVTKGKEAVPKNIIFSGYQAPGPMPMGPVGPTGTEGCHGEHELGPTGACEVPSQYTPPAEVGE